MKRGTEFMINGFGHMTKMASRHLNGKKTLTNLSNNQKSDYLETLGSLGTRDLQSLYKMMSLC